MIEFHLDSRSGVPAYLQLVQQVRQAIRLGILRPGDQLPTVKEVVAMPDDQPEHGAARLPPARSRGARRGTARRRHVRRHHPDGGRRPHDLKGLRSALERWVARARAAGLDEDRIAALFAEAVRPDYGLEGRMSEPVAVRTAGLGKRYGADVGAARLHARDTRGLRNRARRPERRRQDDAPASADRARQADGWHGRGARALAAARCVCAAAAARLRGPGPPSLPQPLDSGDASSSSASSTPAGTTGARSRASSIWASTRATRSASSPAASRRRSR